MSMWQFMAAVDGWAQAHNPDDENTLSADEVDELWDMVKDG